MMINKMGNLHLSVSFGWPPTYYTIGDSDIKAFAKIDKRKFCEAILCKKPTAFTIVAFLRKVSESDLLAAISP